jgi:hypothetical protein
MVLARWEVEVERPQSFVPLGVVFAASCLLVLGGCDARPLPKDVSGAEPDPVSISGLHFTTFSAVPQNPPPTNVDVTLTAPTPSRAIYEATLALPVFPPGNMHCPDDPGYGHAIAFMNGQDLVQTATLNSGGCRDVTISGLPPVRAAVAEYWTLLARNLGVEESALFSLANP